MKIVVYIVSIRTCPKQVIFLLPYHWHLGFNTFQQWCYSTSTLVSNRMGSSQVNRLPVYPGMQDKSA